MQLFTHIYQLKLIPPTGKNIDYINQKLANAINNIGKFLKFQIMDKTETIVQLKKLLASKKAADLLKALKNFNAIISLNLGIQ